MPTSDPVQDTFKVQRKRIGALQHLTPCNIAQVAAVLRDISEGTSYQTVRLVFRPYAHVPPSSCTSERLRPSRELSPPFGPHRHSSLSFGSDRCIHPLSAHDAAVVSLVRVSRRAGSSPFALLIFISHRGIFTLRSRYFFAIGHPLVFSLGCLHHPIQTALPSSPTLRRVPMCLQDSHPLGYGIQAVSTHRPSNTTRLRSYHTGSSAFTRRYSQNPLSFLLLPLLICLSQRGSRARRAHSDTRHKGPHIGFSSVLPRRECQSIP